MLRLGQNRRLGSLHCRPSGTDIHNLTSTPEFSVSSHPRCRNDGQNSVPPAVAQDESKNPQQSTWPAAVNQAVFADSDGGAPASVGRKPDTYTPAPAGARPASRSRVSVMKGVSPSIDLATHQGKIRIWLSGEGFLRACHDRVPGRKVACEVSPRSRCQLASAG
jgi:hypothetical protein